MHKTWLVLKREYLERVRTKSFLVSTILFPTLIAALMLLPSKMATMKSGGTRRVVIASADTVFAQAVQAQLLKPKDATYKVEVDANTSAAEESALRARLESGQIDGFLWGTPEALQSRQVSYLTRESSDFVEGASLQTALKLGLLKRALAQRGVAAGELDDILTDVKLDVVKLKGGKESRTNSAVMFLAAVVLAMMLYMTLLIYGISVMRSVLEEKNSRVMEVLLASVTSKQLMAGKILGVGAAGLTQVAIWVTAGLVLSTPGLVAASSLLKGVDFPLMTIPAFAVFFVLGYLLYSGMYAALGAMVNSEQEAQQFQLLVTLPIVIPTMMMTYVIRQPNAPLSFWMSLVPFFSPILMYLRVVVQTPPLWQVALSVALLAGAVYLMIALCSRIYRVGILMYGKRPTLPEIVKWVRYA